MANNNEQKLYRWVKAVDKKPEDKKEIFFKNRDNKFVGCYKNGTWYDELEYPYLTDEDEHNQIEWLEEITLPLSTETKQIPQEVMDFFIMICESYKIVSDTFSHERLLNTLMHEAREMADKYQNLIQSPTPVKSVEECFEEEFPGATNDDYVILDLAVKAAKAYASQFLPSKESKDGKVLDE